MSEYQYYEFLAIDRPLTDGEMKELRSISSRAEITATRFANEYNWGDLKADPIKLLERYFDAHVYLANWGTRRFAIRLPTEAVDLGDIERYCATDDVSVREAGPLVIIDLLSETEDFEEWIEDGRWMASLAPVRDRLIRGDARPLYLAWLLGVQNDELDDEDIEPPPPPGLDSLSAALRSLVEFLALDPLLVEAAAEASPPEPEEPAALAGWIANLPGCEKDALLLQLVKGEDAHVGASLYRRFRAEGPGDPKRREAARRTVGDLIERAEELREVHARETARRADAERRRREAAATASRAKHLDALAGRQPEAWNDVERLVASKKPRSYDEAVTMLGDLRDLALHIGDGPSFYGRLAVVRERHARKPSFIARLDTAGLLEESP
jgi:hypothetical protein